jgi:hypothetical protein
MVLVSDFRKYPVLTGYPHYNYPLTSIHVAESSAFYPSEDLELAVAGRFSASAYSTAITLQTFRLEVLE